MQICSTEHILVEGNLSWRERRPTLCRHPSCADSGMRSRIAGSVRDAWCASRPGAQPPNRSFPTQTATSNWARVRLDLDDVTLPPVVVHVGVPAISDARGDEFAETMIDGQRASGLRLLRGFRGQFLATYGDHTVQIWTNDRQHVLATMVVTVRPPETESRVVLEIPRR